MEIKSDIPTIFNPLLPGEMQIFDEVVKERKPLLIDSLDSLTDEFLHCSFAAELFEGKSIQEIRTLWLNGRSGDEISCWIYYPWKNTAIRMLKKEEFAVVRTNRNQLKLTPEEQDTLAHKNILFVGLSVGQAAAVTFAMQRMGGHFHLADFDTLSLSNLNRLRASVLDINQFKAVIAARAISELDPYIKISCYNEGINAENIEKIVNPGSGASIDLIVEECDNMQAKILVRQIARKYSIPVIMETSDRGMLDIERYDLEPERAFFHGLANEADLLNYNNLSAGDKSEILFKIVDYKNLSSAMRLSMENIGKTLQTWPQLAYEITLGAATLSHAGMKILLGKNMNSGRYYVDLDKILN